MRNPSNAAAVELTLETRQYAATERQAQRLSHGLRDLGLRTSAHPHRLRGLVVIRAVRVEQVEVRLPSEPRQPSSGPRVGAAYSPNSVSRVRRLAEHHLCDERLEHLLWEDARAWKGYTWTAVLDVHTLERTGFEVYVRDDNQATEALERLTIAGGLHDRITIKPRPGWCGYGHPSAWLVRDAFQ
jgi:hypothetical protein